MNNQYPQFSSNPQGQNFAAMQRNNNVIGMVIPQHKPQQFQQYQDHANNNFVNNMVQQQPNKQQGVGAGNNVNILPLQQEREQQKKNLSANFRWVPSSNTGGVNNVDKEELLLELSQLDIPLRIVLDREFPASKPRIYVRRKITHRFIDDQTWEVIYATFFTWNAQKQLTELLQIIQNQFQLDRPKNDPLRDKIQVLQTKVNEEIEKQKLIKSPLQTIFQNASPDTYASLLNEQSYRYYIENIPEYRTLYNYLIELTDAVDECAGLLTQKTFTLNTKKENLQQVAQDFEQNKSVQVQLLQRVTLIKERFSGSEALTLLEKQIDALEEKSQEKINQLAPQFQAQQQQNTEFEQNVHEFFATRKKHNLLQKKRELYLNNA